MIPYIFLVMFSIVYMGQHYVVDGIVGAVYAVAVYTGIMIVGPKISERLKGSRASMLLSYRPVLVPASAPDELAAFETAEGAS